MNSVPCRYYQSASGCRFGVSCRFSHTNTGTIATTNSTYSSSSQTACRFYTTPSGCRFGDQCYYKHDTSLKPNSASDPTSEDSKTEDTPAPDNKERVIVSGFIRELVRNLSLSSEDTQLTDLIALCQLFYCIIIKWDTNRQYYNSANMRIIANGNCIQKSVGNDWGSAFLTETYDSGVHHWKFKLDSLDTRRKYYVLFGIWKIKSGPPILKSFFTDKKNNGYAMNVIDGTLTIPNTPGCGGLKYGMYCKKGDIIDMFCDFESLKLTFAINGKHYENGQKIEQTQYRVGVTMYWTGDTIRFVSHDQERF